MSGHRIRIIPRLDIKGPNLIKGIHLEGLRILGNPLSFAKLYYAQGADELIYMDSVASLYGRNNLTDIVRQTTDDIFIPFTVGGGIRTLDDVTLILRSGADKVAINTQATKRPEFISEVAKRFGSQCMVLSVEAKRRSPGEWMAYTDNGREPTGLSVIEWVARGIELGAGEILLTSVDQEGTTKGFDFDLIRSVARSSRVPLIASGGMGTLSDLRTVVEDCGADAVAIASVLHYKKLSLAEIKSEALRWGWDMRVTDGPNET